MERLAELVCTYRFHAWGRVDNSRRHLRTLAWLGPVIDDRVAGWKTGSHLIGRSSEGGDDVGQECICTRGKCSVMRGQRRICAICGNLRRKNRGEKIHGRRIDRMRDTGGDRGRHLSRVRCRLVVGHRRVGKGRTIESGVRVTGKAAIARRTLERRHSELVDSSQGYIEEFVPRNVEGKWRSGI